MEKEGPLILAGMGQKFFVKKAWKLNPALENVQGKCCFYVHHSFLYVSTLYPYASYIIVGCL